VMLYRGGNRTVLVVDDEEGVRLFVRAIMEQEGWVVRYEGFMEVGEYRLPQRLEVTREDVLVRLAVRQWEPVE